MPLLLAAQQHKTLQLRLDRSLLQVVIEVAIYVFKKFNYENLTKEKILSQHSSDFPTISITGDLFPVAEDSGLTEVFTSRLSEPAPAGGLVVNVNTFDSDGSGGDEEVSTTDISDIALNDQNAPVSFTIAEEATEAQIILPPIPDDLLEGTEINSITLLPGSNYRVNPFLDNAITTLSDSLTPSSGVSTSGYIYNS
jgi:hypothetical protein